MSFRLSKGNLEMIANGSQPQKPVFQILGCKKINSTVQSNTDRYRLLLSDGVKSHSAMLATQLNSKVASGDLDPRTIIQLDKYICNTIADNKRVMIILEISVVAKGSEVTTRIGNPEPLTVGGARKPAGQQQQSPQNKPMGGPRKDGDMTNQMPKLPTTPGGGMSKVFPIASLTPYQNRWTIRARVTNKGKVRNWSNSRGEGCLFSMDLIDDSAEIRATAFNDQCRKFFDMITVGKVYYFSRGTLKTANKQYTSIKNDYEMTFTGETQVQLCDDVNTDDIPDVQFDFKPISKLEEIEKDTMVDIIGVCKSTGELTTITTRATNKEVSKKDVHLVDDSEKVVTMTLWGEEAEKFDGSSCPVIAIKGAKLSDYGGRSLSMLQSSVLQINPDIPRAHHLKGWYDGVGQSKEIQSISEQRSGGASTNWKNLSEVRSNNLGMGEKPDYFTAKATVVFIRKENCMYKACPSSECNKKVIENTDGTYRCEKCNKEYPDFKYRLLLSANVVDFGDGQWATCFQDQAETLLGQNADYVGNLRDTNEVEYDELFQEANFKSYNFRMRIKQETYNDETRLKTSVVDVKRLDFKEYTKKLIMDIRSLASS
ncbi:replication protein A 70 kDa DNA-binding subunit-like [Ptychodera flava]|uniref:replication protein A 70 kDa DNA-binding subunit-like n=1 Tax=Ptychodera flava TaxID=63121 RepID=UPI003969BCC2